jgi:hypothetical protein
MKEFETIGPDGRVYLHYQNWERWRADRMNQYPCPEGHYRFDIELTHPRLTLAEVPVEHNPHHGGYGPHACFYACDNWSTIFGVHDAHLAGPGESLRMLVESGCPEPIWGERMLLLSTSSAIITEPWGWGIPNRFARFRGCYWRVSVAQLLHEYGDVHRASGIGFCPLMCNMWGPPFATERFVWTWNDWNEFMPVVTLRRTPLVRLRDFWPDPESVDWHKEGF